MSTKRRVLDAIAESGECVQMIDSHGRLHEGWLWHGDEHDWFVIDDILLDTYEVDTIEVLNNDTSVITLKQEE